MEQLRRRAAALRETAAGLRQAAFDHRQQVGDLRPGQLKQQVEISDDEPDLDPA